MRETHTNRYTPGTYWRECYVCGFDYLRNEMVTDRYGHVVCNKCNYSEDSYDERDRPNVTESILVPDGLGQISVP
jgi:hypothetical protein